MAWTAPMTFVAGTVLTAAQLNTYLRDNMLETAPAKASARGQLFVATAANAIAARIATQQAVVASQSHTGDTNWSDLSTVGPAIGPITTGTQAWVWIAAEVEITQNYQANMSWEVTGASAISPDNLWSVGLLNKQASSDKPHFGELFLQTGLTAGLNTFTAKYKVSNSAANGIWGQRILGVFPF